MRRFGLCILVALFVFLWTGPGSPARSTPPCQQAGWFPTSFGLKDHHIFRFDGRYYLVSNYLPGEDRFAYAVSDDLCAWQELPPVLGRGKEGSWDEMAIWSPFVYAEAGVYYLYYTGVDRNFTQTIMLATSTNPADPSAWHRQGAVFQPRHFGAVWQAGQWADNRDPAVIRVDGLYYLVYTGLDVAGGILGQAIAASPEGPWLDLGALLPAMAGYRLESASLVEHGGSYYLSYHLNRVSAYPAVQQPAAMQRPAREAPAAANASLGTVYRIGPDPGGPWSEPAPLAPGWAHEFWQGRAGEWYASYLTDYTISISPLTWDGFFTPARPLIGVAAYHLTYPFMAVEAAPGR